MERGRHKAGLRNRVVTDPRCASMAVGSVPHVDPEAAVALVLKATPEVPTWPQLPRRAYRENMYVQFTEGLPGVVVDDAAQRVYVRDEIPAEEVLQFLDAYESGDPAAFAVSPAHAATLPLLGRALRDLETIGSPPPFVKGQITGPVSFALTVPREDRRALFFDDTMRDIATRLLTRKARWQADLLAAWSPSAVPLVMVDEPCLTQVGSAVVNVPMEPAMDSLGACLESVDCLSGIHVCGGTDWERILSLPVDVLNFDAADHLQSVIAHREAVGVFLTEGGFIAWGAVPNDERALARSPEETAALVVQGAEDLAAVGQGPTVDGILRASFISPACGTGALSLELAERCFALVAETTAFLRARL